MCVLAGGGGGGEFAHTVLPQEWSVIYLFGVRKGVCAGVCGKFRVTNYVCALEKYIVLSYCQQMKAVVSTAVVPVLHPPSLAQKTRGEA